MNSVRLYNTEIVVWDENSITLNTGGYETQTTLRNMNKAGIDLGFSVSKKNYQMFVNFKGRSIPFSNTIVLDRNTSEFIPPEQSPIQKATKKSKILQSLAKKRKIKSGTNNSGPTAPS